MLDICGVHVVYLAYVHELIVIRQFLLLHDYVLANCRSCFEHILCVGLSEFIHVVLLAVYVL